MGTRVRATRRAAERGIFIADDDRARLTALIHRVLDSGQEATPLAALAGEGDVRATFAFRLGWPTRRAPASPRRDLASVVLPAACAGAPG